MAEAGTSKVSFFRQESLRSRELAWEGRPAIALGLPAMFTSLSSVALAAAAVALITFGGYTRRVDMEGRVLPSTGVITITAPSPGRIETLAVQEGETVKKGALIYTVDLDTATKDGDTQQRIIEAQTSQREMLTREIERKTRMSAETEQDLRWKIETFKSNINQVEDQITFQQTLVKKVSEDYNQFASFVERHLVSLNELTARQQAWMQALARLQDLQNSELRMQGELKDAQFQLATTAHTRSDEIDTLKTKILETNEKLANSEAHHLIEIRSPENGVIAAILAHPGQTVGASVPVLKIVPRDAPMQAELLAPSTAIGFIHEGGRVLLRYSAFPYQKFGEYPGTVVGISRAAINAEEVKSVLGEAEPGRQAGPLYRVIVKPDTQKISIYGEARSLPAGMQVNAYALLERRRLYEWILEPLYDVGRALRAS